MVKATDPGAIFLEMVLVIEKSLTSTVAQSAELQGQMKQAVDIMDVMS